MSGRGRSVRALALAVGCTALGGIPVWLLSAHAPAMGATLGYGEAGLGMLISAFFAISAIGGFTAGRAVEARGWMYGVVASGLIIGVTMGAIALLPMTVLLLAVLLSFSSVGNALCQPAANAAIADAVPFSRQGLAFGIKQAAMPLSTFAVGASLPLFLGAGGWRWAYACAGALGFLVCLAAVIRPRRRREAAAEGRVRTVDVVHETRGRGPRLRELRVAQSHRRALQLLAAGAGLAVAATMSIAGFLVVSVVADGWSAADAGRLLALGSVASVVTRLVAGAMTDRRSGRHLVMVTGMMFAGVVGMVLLAVGGHPAVTVIGTVLAFGLGWAWNGVFAFAVVRYSGGSPAMATGMIQSAMAGGSAVGPLMFGWLSVWHSFSAAWAVSAVMLASGAVVILMGRRALPPNAAAASSTPAVG